MFNINGMGGAQVTGRILERPHHRVETLAENTWHREHAVGLDVGMSSSTEGGGPTGEK
jgi:hypothetical protein